MNDTGRGGDARYYRGGGAITVCSYRKVMTVTLKPKSEITVPPSIRRKAGLKTGDRLAFKVSGRTITIVPERVSAPELTALESRLVRRGEAQLKRGESKSWRAVKHDLAR